MKTKTIRQTVTFKAAPMEVYEMLMDSKKHTSSATIDMRLVKGMNLNFTAQRLIDHIRKEGFFVVDHEPSADVRRAHAKVALVTVKPGGYNSVRTPMDLPISQEVVRTVESVRGPAVRVPNSGASVPLDMIERVLGTRTISIPIANHDDNQHTFDETCGFRTSGTESRSWQP